MKTLFGIPVHISNHPMIRPKLQLMPNTPVSDEFRSEMNAWLLEMFGMERYAIELGKEKGLLIDQETLRLLQQNNMAYAPFKENP
ncbi:MAG: hypothetical protein WC825_02245 [Gallionellaceae bacterium]